MTPALVGRRVQHVRIARIHQQVGHPGVVADLEHLRPRFVAVAGQVHATFATRAPQRTLCGDINGVGVLRMNQDAGDVFGALEAHVAETLAAVDRFVDAVAVGHRALAVVLAGAYPDRQRVVWIDDHGAHRVGAVLVEDRLPLHAGVDCFPHTARGDAHVPGALVRRINRDLGNPARHERGSDAAPLQRRHRPGGQAAVFLRGFLLGDDQRRGGERSNQTPGKTRTTTNGSSSGLSPVCV